MPAYVSNLPLVPYEALQANVIVPAVYGAMINYYENRVPLQQLLKHNPVGSPTFYVTNDNFRPRSVNLSGAYSTTGTTLTFADATSFDLGDVLRVDNELFLVTATHATTPTVAFAYGGSTNAAHTSGTPAYLITNTRTGAEVNIAGLSRTPVTVQQTTQTIEHAYQVGGALQAISNYVSGEGSPLDRERMMAARHCLDDFESALYGTTSYSTAVTYSTSSGARPLMKGLATLIVTNRQLTPVNGAAYKPSDLARDTFTACYQAGGNPTLLIVSTDWMPGLMTWGNAIVRVPAGENVYGTEIATFKAPFINDITIVPAPLLTPGTAICLSQSEVGIRMMRDLYEKPRGSRGDATEGDFIMEGALQLNNEAHHAYVTGITGWSAS